MHIEAKLAMAGRQPDMARAADLSRRALYPRRGRVADFATVRQQARQWVDWDTPSQKPVDPAVDASICVPASLPPLYLGPYLAPDNRNHRPEADSHEIAGPGNARTCRSAGRPFRSEPDYCSVVMCGPIDEETAPFSLRLGAVWRADAAGRSAHRPLRWPRRSPCRQLAEEAAAVGGRSKNVWSEDRVETSVLFNGRRLRPALGRTRLGPGWLDGLVSPRCGMMVSWLAGRRRGP